MTSTETSTATGRGAGEHKHLGLALIVIAAAQLMVVLDATIVNIALPKIQVELGFSATNLAWVVNAYTLAFGGLLLLGGRAGDLFGKRKMFVVGIGLFSFASLIGGFAQNEAQLIIARVVQGVGAAIAAPTALSLVTVTFPEGPARNRAMAVYAAMSGLGAAVGLLLGGVLTEYVDWSWVFFVNVPIGLLVIFGTGVLGEGARLQGRFDVPGALTGTLGLTALVYGIMRGNDEGWLETFTVASFVTSAVAVGVFLVIESRHEDPIMPLRLFKDRNRSGAYGSMLVIGAGVFAMFYFLGLFLQQVLGYSPIKAGLAYLPFTFGIAAAAGMASKLVLRFAPRYLVATGLALATAGMLWLSTLTPESTYLASLLGPMVMISFGMGLCFIPLTLCAVSNVGDEDSGIASALLNTAQQIGGAIGLAVLATISTTTSEDQLPDAADRFVQASQSGDGALLAEALDALTTGYTSALFAGAFFLVVGAVIAVIAVNAARQEPADGPVHLG